MILLAEILVKKSACHPLFGAPAASLVLQLERDEVEEFVDRHVLEVATRAIRVSEKPLQHLFIGILSTLVVRVIAFP